MTSERRPDVVVILVDDMGYSDLGCFGGEIRTPNIDALAASGVRATQFYNTARCSPSRASLLTGLHPHQTGVAELVNDDGPGGYRGSLADRTATLAEVFGAAGYSTWMRGKWHVSAERETPSASWPTRRGFDSFWGTIGGAASYFQPTTLHDGERPIRLDELDDDFYYTDEIGRRSAEAVRAADPDRPFFGYVAFTAPHWPLHAREVDRARTRGRYDEGWDVLRERRWHRQLDDGICTTADTVDVRDPEVPAWDDEPERAWQAERMEAYAAQVEAMDRAVGAILDALDETGRRDGAVVVLLSDNGGCAEELSADPEAAERFRHHRLIIPPSAPDGTPMKVGNAPSIHPGTADTYSSYGRGWANLSNTPFRMYKRWVHEGGIATPLIVSWPAGGLDDGSVVRVPAQLTDLAPTLFEATGVAPLAVRDGLELPPLPGVSLLGALRGGPAVEHPLFWEHIGNQAMRDGRWKVVREHGGDWELYDLTTDRSEQHDLSDGDPDRVAGMVARWREWAEGVGVLPYEQVLAARSRMPAQEL